MNKEKITKTIISTIIPCILITILCNLKLINYNKYFILPIILLIITYMYSLYKDKLIINEKGYIYLIPIILIILGTVLFKTDISNKVINIVILPYLIINLFLIITNKNYHLSDKFILIFKKIFPDNLLSNISLIGDNVNINKDKKTKIKNISLGILLGFPIIVVILILLSSADIYFNTFISKINYKFMNMLNFKNIIKNIGIFIFYFIIFFSTYINIINNTKTQVPDSKIRKIEPTIITPILIMMNAIFVLFIISQISKISGNFLNLPNEYTYALYAREGFFQLLFVTIINFSIILLLIYKTDALNNKLIKILVTLLIGFTIILIFNSYYRMYLYINEFGFTILRMQVILFMLMELILLIILIKKIFYNLKHNDCKLFEAIIITTYIINIFICNHNVIALIDNLINKPYNI